MDLTHCTWKWGENMEKIKLACTRRCEQPKGRLQCGGRYWVRTSDLFRVKEARYRCANRPRWVRDSNPCIRLCRPLPRLSANPPRENLTRLVGMGQDSERMTGLEPATLTLAR